VKSAASSAASSSSPCRCAAAAAALFHRDAVFVLCSTLLFFSFDLRVWGAAVYCSDKSVVSYLVPSSVYI
jgi:hypothetical protein